MTSRVLFAVLLTATSCLVALARPSTLLRAAPSDVEGRGAREDSREATSSSMGSARPA